MIFLTFLTHLIRLGDAYFGKSKYEKALSMYIAAVQKCEDATPVTTINRIQVRFHYREPLPKLEFLSNLWNLWGTQVKVAKAMYKCHQRDAAFRIIQVCGDADETPITHSHTLLSLSLSHTLLFFSLYWAVRVTTLTHWKNMERCSPKMDRRPTLSRSSCISSFVITVWLFSELNFFHFLAITFFSFSVSKLSIYFPDHRGAKRHIAKILNDGSALPILKYDILSPEEIAKGMRSQKSDPSASQAPAFAYIAVMIKEFGGDAWVKCFSFVCKPL